MKHFKKNFFGSFSLKKRILVLSLTPILFSIVVAVVGESLFSELAKKTTESFKYSKITTYSSEVSITANAFFKQANKALYQAASHKDLEALEDLEIELTALDDAVLGFVGEGLSLDELKESTKKIDSDWKNLSANLQSWFDRISEDSEEIQTEDLFSELVSFEAKVSSLLKTLNKLNEKPVKLSFELFKLAPQLQQKYKNFFYIVLALLFAVGLVSFFTANRIVESLRKIIRRVTNDSGSAANIAAKVKSSASILSSSVSRQGSAIQETVSSMQEISSMISKTTEQSKTANDETQRLVVSMADLKETNRNLKQLESTFKAIETKTQIINDIVFKTQLLSFNASIEAARAGAHGKGFAVVAQEVGKLADLSGSAAEEINSLLANSDSQIRDTVAQTSERIERFESALNQVSIATESITQASHEQENGVQQTNAAMDQMDSVTQENSDNAEELLQISGTLQDNSRNLQEATKDLNDIVVGKKISGTDEAGLISTVARIFDFNKFKENSKKNRNDFNEGNISSESGNLNKDIDGDDDSFKPAV
ncbi:MAG: hypothetical protein H6618_03200 [Deltaproteobacteria bacterium]|nr:hypothetical protein [Deltaproteobacteria bacterium]